MNLTPGNHILKFIIHITKNLIFRRSTSGQLMIQYIHLSPTLGKGIKRLRKAGKQGEQAVNSFEEILSDLKNFSCRYKATVCKRTKNGEQRIRNCIKYDLGGGVSSGYRPSE